jgi:putative flippase GtrA
MAVSTNCTPPAEPMTIPRGDRISNLMTGWVGRLPAPLARTIPRDMAGYAVLGLVTFGVALLLLLLLNRVAALPLTQSVLMADVAAWVLNFWLNRTLNFRSRSGIGPQAARYGLVVCGDLAISTGVTTALVTLGAPIPVARITAGGCIALVGYLSCRFWVFRPGGYPGYSGQPQTSEPSGAQPSAESTAIATNTSDR